MNEQTRCSSPICIVQNSVRGRLFTPPENAKGVNAIWCPECIKITGQMNFYAHQTAEMIRGVYNQYKDTDLPKNVKLILEQFVAELLRNLNEEP